MSVLSYGNAGYHIKEKRLEMKSRLKFIWIISVYAVLMLILPVLVQAKGSDYERL